MRAPAAAAVALGVLLGAAPGWGQTVIRDPESGTHIWCPKGGRDSAVVTVGGYYSWLRVGDPLREGTWTSLGNGCYVRPMSPGTRRDLLNTIENYCVVLGRNCFRNPR